MEVPIPGAAVQASGPAPTSGHVNCSNPFCTECGVFTKELSCLQRIFCLEEKTVEVFFERYLLPWEKKPAYMRSDYGRLCVCVCVFVCVRTHIC